ncbi:MAG: hypothetical protein GY938_20475 [Ketobacter sp.]|nr:hypothetical protein [Ketobacter sp.]
MSVAYMFNTFATAGDVQRLNLDIWYQSYYLMLDDYDEAIAEDNADLAAEYKRRMERLLAQICEEDPEWERCK